ncbi:MAG: hypothetical protein ACK57T_02310 [Dolichospermum sp.]
MPKTCSLFPVPCSLFPVPCSLVITTIFNANLLTHYPLPHPPLTEFH